MTLPDGWTETTLGELGRYINGRGFKKSEWKAAGRPIIRIQNLTGSGTSFNYFDGPVEERYVVRDGDLLVSWAATLGAYIWRGPDALLNQHIFRVESYIDPGFHKYLLDFKLQELMRHTHGSGMVHITKGKFDSVPVALPPLEEQRRIVDQLEAHFSRLDVAEQLLARSRRRLRPLELLELQHSLDESAVPEVPLSAFVERVEAGRSFGSSAPPAEADEWGIVKVSAMTWGAFRPGENKAVPSEAVDPRFEIKAGDLLVSRANTTAYVGAAVLVGETRPKLLLSDKSLRVVPRPGVDPRWLLAAISSPRARSQISALATGTKDSMRNISQGNLLSVRVPNEGAEGRGRVVLARQRTVDRGTRLDGQLQLMTTKAKSLRRAVLATALTGRLTSFSADGFLKEMAGV